MKRLMVNLQTDLEVQTELHLSMQTFLLASLTLRLCPGDQISLPVSIPLAHITYHDLVLILNRQDQDPSLPDLGAQFHRGKRSTR